MVIHVFEESAALSRAAAERAAAELRRAIAARGAVRLVAATGTSQIGFLGQLVRVPGVDWSRVELFHLDEYLGLSPDHPASFCRFILDRLVRPAGIQRCHLLEGRTDARELVRRVGAELAAAPIDLAFVGVGENGHLAFNEPPADFEAVAPFLVVRLDEVSRAQQVREGWFAELADVPERAITMSIPQILRARTILCLVPEARKARAVQACFAGPVSPAAPASILQHHPGAVVYLDRASAAGLPPDAAASVYPS